MENKDYGLGTEEIKSLVLKLSIPSIIGMLANALYNIIDRVFIGQGVNEIAIGGVYVTLPLMFIIMSFQMLASVGGSTLMSISLGEGNRKKAEQFLNTSFLLCLILSILMPTLFYIFADNLLNLVGSTPENHQYAKEYFDIVLFGAPAVIVGFGLNNFIRASGDSKAAMNTILIGVILNTILDPIFIFGLKMGVKGAALATVISQYVSMVWVLMHFIKGKHTLRLDTKYMRFDRKILSLILENGMPLFLMNIANAMVTSIITINVRKYGGTLGISALSIVGSVTNVFFMPLFGINQGIQPIIAYNYGAKDYERLSKAYKIGALYATYICVVVFLIIMIFPYQISSIFLNENADPKLLEMVAPALRKSMYASIFLGVSITGTSFFQAVKRPRIASSTSLLRQLLILVPLIYIMPMYMGIDGIWYAYSVSDFISSIIVFYFLFKIFKLVKIECEQEGDII